MKNFNKLFGSLFLAFGVMGMASLCSASSGGVRSPKQMFEQQYTIAISSVTPFTVLESTSGIAKPGAVYQLILSTGTAGDYVVLFDTSTATTLSIVGATPSVAQMGPRYFYGSTSANTVITFDPPLIFFNGLMVGSSSSTDSFGVTYELGRGLSGN